MSINLWFEHVIDGYLLAVAQGHDWKSACADAERANKGKPLRVLTCKDLQSKGISYSRQHIARRVAANTFPAPFNLPDEVT
jgi:hypothetical protein